MLCTAGAAEKVLLSELLQPVSTSSALGSVRKQLRRVKEKKAVELPLSKEESERVSSEHICWTTSCTLENGDSWPKGCSWTLEVEGLKGAT